jgi:hypothetical protein
MASKKHQAEEIVPKLRQVEVLTAGQNSREVDRIDTNNSAIVIPLATRLMMRILERSCARNRSCNVLQEWDAAKPGSLPKPLYKHMRFHVQDPYIEALRAFSTLSIC